MYITVYFSASSANLQTFQPPNAFCCMIYEYSYYENDSQIDILLLVAGVEVCLRV